MTKISHISTIGVNLDFLDWKKQNDQNDQNETKQAKRAKRNETSETSGTTKTKQTLGHNEMTETIKGTYENRKKVNNNNKIKWMPKGVRRQASADIFVSFRLWSTPDLPHGKIQFSQFSRSFKKINLKNWT